MTTTMTREKTIIDPDRECAENDADRWVLALRAPYLEQAFALLDSEPIWFENIDGGSPPDAANNCRRTLEDDWGITDKESTIKEVRVLLDVGHREEYDKHRTVMVENELIGKPESTLRAVARFCVDNSPEIKEENRDKASDYLASVYLFISQAEPTLGEGGIGGWDFVRVGNVLSLALGGGLIEDRDCWGRGPISPRCREMKVGMRISCRVKRVRTT